jgi:SAM-dependent methyltransferase
MTSQIYGTPQDALAATDEFYSEEGFSYSLDQVCRWLKREVRLPASGRVLDLCCGDGIWARGIAELGPSLEIFGIDISPGGIARARELLGADDQHFVVGDAEADLPFADGMFDLIFARGPGLYNQHSMDRPATIAVIEGWHRKLAPTGRMYSIFASNPRRMGTYTPPEQVKLPYNRCSRLTPAVDFRGGKYHHSIETFLAPFWKAHGLEVESYRFVNNLHIAVTRRVTDQGSS